VFGGVGLCLWLAHLFDLYLYGYWRLTQFWVKVLQGCVHMLTVSMDCPFLIAPLFSLTYIYPMIQWYMFIHCLIILLRNGHCK
jgi:hypothetical protein